MHGKTKMLKALKDYPVLPSLRREEEFTPLLASRPEVVLISSGSILNISGYVQKLRGRNKTVLVHLDLIGGLGRDRAALRFLKEVARVDGIVTPNHQVISAARKEGLITVHRLFALDSPSMETGLKILQQSKPDFIEILPGLAVLKTIHCIRRHLTQPVIAAGLIKTPREVREVLKGGAVAVDTSTPELWDIEI